MSFARPRLDTNCLSALQWDNYIPHASPRKRTWGIFLMEGGAVDRKAARPRGTGIYDKPALDHQALVSRMSERGLKIPDKKRAQRYVQSVGYYRLSPYMIPFREAGSDYFRASVEFDDILDLYVFDRKLRLLVLDALERVEVAVRAALIDHMSQTHGAFWYQDLEHFRDHQKHQQFIDMMRQTCQKQLKEKPEKTDGALAHQSALEHYLLTYAEPELPPSWIIMERLTLGQVEHLIHNLVRRSDRTAVAQALGINEPLLHSWLRSFVRVRNICTHHGRLWNTVLGVAPALPTSRAVVWLTDDSLLRKDAAQRARLYTVLASLQTFPGAAYHTEAA